MGPILDTVATSCTIEGMICEEQGACKRIHRTLLHFIKAHDLVALALTL
jgi:hypothetical protein